MRPLFLVGLALFFATPAFGYVDPGSGYYVFQLLAALAAGSLYYVARIPKLLRTYFRRKTVTPAHTTPPSTSTKR